jgi:hypothetical protein
LASYRDLLSGVALKQGRGISYVPGRIPVPLEGEQRDNILEKIRFAEEWIKAREIKDPPDESSHP